MTARDLALPKHIDSADFAPHRFQTFNELVVFNIERVESNRPTRIHDKLAGELGSQSD